MAETPSPREPGYAQRYRDERFPRGTGPRTDRRERAVLQALLAQAAATGRLTPGSWLDVPAGAGRLTAELPGPAVAVDRDAAMLQAADGLPRRACASAQALPFRDRAFAGVLCHRLLQHIPTAAERVAILRELARVARGVVIVSFFDSMTLPGLRRVVRRWAGKRRSGRSSVRRAAFLAECREAGLQPLCVRSLCRFVSEQTLVLCAPPDPA
ncbi:MAG: class I SAM-dependent methyltransferase [Planctomycetota bacterium]